MQKHESRRLQASRIERSFDEATITLFVFLSHYNEIPIVSMMCPPCAVIGRLTSGPPRCLLRVAQDLFAITMMRTLSALDACWHALASFEIIYKREPTRL